MRPLPNVQLVILGFCAHDQALEKSLFDGCVENSFEVVEHLLGLPLDPDKAGKRRAPIHIAAKRGS